MSDTSSTTAPFQLSAAAAAQWIQHVESVLRGVAHTLNNRAAALAAVIELSTEPAEQPAVLREILAGEQQRVRDLVQVLRIIGIPRGAGGRPDDEAFSPADVAAEVALVMEQHPDFRDGAVQFDASGAAPVRVPRWAFARALIALAGGLREATRSSPARIVLADEGEWLTISAGSNGGTPSPLAIELARHMGGEALPGSYGIRVPTLAALRRREGR